MLRTDLHTKRAAFLYQFFPLPDGGEHFIQYDPLGLDTVKESLVIYQCTPYSNAIYSRDSYNWTTHTIDIETPEIDNTMVAKYHQDWTTCLPLARDIVLERGHSSLYVANMLYHFQEALKAVWIADTQQTIHEMRYNRQLHAQSLSLKMPPVCLLFTIGPKVQDSSRWLLCKAAHSPHMRYVHEYQFNKCHPAEDPWADLIMALIHYVYKRTGGHSLIAQVDCDLSGILSNLVCFAKG
ncbi:hypothetical protein DFH28DRAFT_881696 [Melampsora americana]|nr:hypothetical protein DFH28DRAFT_881696 [Melampsora americana]